MTRVVVEAAFGQALTAASTWTDITGYVDLVTGLSITRGAADELTESQPGTLTLRLDNGDGRFTPGRASSPYYPDVRRGTPIRVRVLTTATNLVEFSTFESTITGWLSTGPVLSRSNTRAWQGTWSLQADWQSTSTTVGPETTVYGLDADTTYTASAYVWVPAGSTAVRLGVVGLATGTVSTTTDAWERITYTFVATATSHRLQLTGTAPAAGQSVWLDAVQVEEGTTATTFSSDVQVIGRFLGMVGQWPTSWEGLYSTVMITCTDTFKWIARRSETRPMLDEEILADNPVAFYPLTEPSDATSAGDVSGTTAGALAITQVGSGGTLAFASAAGPATTGALVPQFTPSSSTAGKYLTGDLGPDVEGWTTVSGTYANVFVECWFSTSTVSRALLGLSSSDSVSQLVFSLDSSGALQVESTNTGGSTVPSAVSTGNLADGVLHHLLYDHAGQTVYIDGTSYSMSSYQVSALRTLAVGGYSSARLWSGIVSHVALFAVDGGSAVGIGNYTPHYTAGVTGFASETTSARISRLATYAGVTSVTAQGTTFSNIAAQGQLGSSLLQHMRDVELCESGHLIASRTAAGLLFQARSARYNPTPAASLAYADLEPGTSLSDDDQKMVNTITASRPGGATQRVVDRTSRAAYGPYEQTLDLLATTDNETLDAANWRISRYADPPPEIRDIAVEAYTLGLTAYRALLNADVSTALTITGLPAEAPSSTATVTVEGYTETISSNQHTLAFHVSRTDTDTVWVLDSSTYSVLDSTTRLAY